MDVLPVNDFFWTDILAEFDTTGLWITGHIPNVTAQIMYSYSI